MVLLVGCASSPVKITYTPAVEGKLLGSGAPQIATVEIEPSAYGRQCFDTQVGADGTVNVTFAVDATSDWAGIRVLPLVIPQTVAAVMAVAGAPFDIIKGLLGVPQPEMAPPSNLSACDAIYEEPSWWRRLF